MYTEHKAEILSLSSMLNEAHGTKVVNDMGSPLILTSKAKKSECHLGLFSLKGQFLISKTKYRSSKGLHYLPFLGQCQQVNESIYRTVMGSA